MERVGEHPIPAGPLAVRWQAYELTEQRAGVTTTARIRIENAGSAPWRSRGREGIQLAYHWLDPLGNAIVWDGTRSPLPEVVRPGDTVELESPLTAPRPPGLYRLAFDLVDEFRFWFQEIGSTALDLPVEVRPRIDEPVDAAIVAELTDALPEFRLAYEPDGLAPDELERYGATVRTLRTFIGASYDLQARIRDVTLPDPDIAR